MQLVFTLLATLPVAQSAVQDHAAHKPLLRTVDLDRGESQVVELADGTRARVKLLDVEEERDGVRSAIRQARVKVEINGRATTLISANYRLPITVGGVQIDCPVTRGYYTTTRYRAKTLTDLGVASKACTQAFGRLNPGNRLEDKPLTAPRFSPDL
jgi:hypothetical protein